MISSKKDLYDYLKVEEELYRSIGYKGAVHAFITQCEVGYIAKYMMYLRKDEYYSNVKSGLWGKLCNLYYRRLHNKLGVQLGICIPINTFGKGLLIYHSQGIIVHKDARCGEYCKLHGNVCIGNNGVETLKRNVPYLGNNIDIGANSSIIGVITLGDDIKIGAGAVVCNSCNQKGAVLVGVPAKNIIRED